ncbi:hypothetical protein Tco_0425826 [Tanacetum coccineum]
MSSPDHPTANLEDVFSSNFPNYVPPVSPDYVPASPGKTYSSASNLFGIAPPTLSLFPDDPYMKALQAFYTKKSSIPPRFYYLLNSRICSSSSSSTTLSNSSWNQTCDLVSPSSSVYTPTPPQIFEIGKCPIKMYLKHHEGQIEDILNYLDELYLHHIEKMEEGRIDRMIIRRNSDELKTELKKIRTQIIKLQKKRLGQKDKIAFAHYRISDLERIIEKIQARHQTNQEDL